MNLVYVDCGNCPLDGSTLGCHLDGKECESFATLVELSWERALRKLKDG